MTLLYGRRLQLLVGGPPLASVSTPPGTAASAAVAGGNGTPTQSSNSGLDLSQMAVQFRVTHASTQGPKTAMIRVWNLSRQTTAKIRHEYSRVVLSAGYSSGQYGTLFDGTIKQLRYGREDSVNAFTDILAAENDIAYTQATVSTTCAAGATPADLFRAAAAGYAPYGITVAPLPAGMTAFRFPRGRVLHGMVRDVLRELAGIVGGQVVFRGQQVGIALPAEPASNQVALVLTSQTGLIGVPVQTQEGIIVRCLLNSGISPNSVVQLDNKDVLPAPYTTAYQGEAQNTLLPGFDPNGLYKVWFVDHVGETRGNDWYSEMVTSALDQSVMQPSGGAPLQAVPGAGQ